MPRRIIISLVIIALSLAAFWLMPNQVGERYDNLFKNQPARPAGEIKIYTFTEFYKTLAPQQQNCFKDKVSTARIGELLNGSQIISDNELKELNNCSQ